MTRTVLGKITSSADRPRGADVELELRLPEDWILSGATIELELPRNLRCAACSGGGCDACERSGAVTLRGRKEPPEFVEVTLPRDHTHLVMRIPERGGLPPENSDLPRGNLLLSLEPGPLPEKGVQRLSGPSIPPPPIPEVVKSYRPKTRRAGRPAALSWIAIAVVIVVIVWVLAHVAR